MSSRMQNNLLSADLLEEAPGAPSLFDGLGNPLLGDLTLEQTEESAPEEGVPSSMVSGRPPSDRFLNVNLGGEDSTNVASMGVGAQMIDTEPAEAEDHDHNDVLPPVDLNYGTVSQQFGVELSAFDVDLDLSKTFTLHSNPDAAHTIYLDFDGHETTHWAWTRFNNDQAIETAAYDLDGNADVFSDQELSQIQYIWQRVAEDFIPFEVNVTTEDPGEEALRRTSLDDQSWGTRVVIGAGDWLGVAAGGVAYLSTFADSEDLPAFVFTNYLDNGNEKATAEAISHEVGHTLGLEHDGQYDNEYYIGHAVDDSGWAPIMGAGYFLELTQWSQGGYEGSTNGQDDLSIITSQNGFGYRADDHGDDFENSTYIKTVKKSSKAKKNNKSNQSQQRSSIYAEGIIEQNTDSDIFVFRTGKGQVNVNINPVERGANLNVLANLYDRYYNLVATSNPTDSLSAGFNLNLNAGIYYLEVQGAGQGDPFNGGYSDYGSLGQYTIEATVQDEVTDAIHDLEGVTSDIDGYVMASMALVSGDVFDYVAVQDGSWFDVATWEGGVVPFDGAMVHIPEGVTVTYDSESDARIDKISLDGTLVFAPDQNTRMIVDTIMASGTSTLTIGTADNPVQANIQTQIIIDSQSAVSDEAQIEKGIISMGTVSIYGADKLDFVALQDAFAGDNKLVLDLPDGTTEPLGWQVGDRLVLGGTDYDPNGDNADNSKFQDEVLTITAINGNEISFINENITSGNNTVLLFDHVRQQGYEDQLDIYVANTTRNVSISSEDGESIEKRGHVMFMHSDDVKVFNAGFYDLGRTDKSRLIDEVGTNPDGSIGNGTNVRGRYALHFHHVGLHDSSEMHHGSDMMHMPMTTPGVASGNAIVGSPGWGLVHHNSNATFEDNVVFDVVGAGIVSEGGAEIGSWTNNITIKTTGDADPHHGFGHNGARVLNYDLGFNGEGYWVQGAGQIVMTDNIAVSAAGAGLTVFGGGDGGASARDQHTIAVSNLPAEWQDIAQGYGDGSVVDVATVPLRLLSGFEAYNVDDGILTWGTMLNGDGQHRMDVPGAHEIDTVVPAHDYRATVDDFKLWQVRKDGVQLWYSSQYDLSNGLILANESIHPYGRGNGIANNGKNHTFKNLHVEGFQVGLQLPNDGTDSRGEFRHRDLSASVLEDSYISGVRGNFSNFGDDAHYFELRGNNTFGPVELEPDNQLPVADFDVETLGGLAYQFDAANSFDSDPVGNVSQFETQGIIAYGWDFDADGIIDGFGRTARHRFDQTGDRDVTLTVWDQYGATTSLTQTIDVQNHTSVNVFLNGDFSEDNFKNYSRGSSLDANLGWAKSTGTYDPPLGNNGALVLTTGSTYSAGVVQVIEDDYIRQGMNLLSVTLKNTEGDARVTRLNDIEVTLFGINGQFDNRASDKTRAPLQVGALPFEMTQIFTTDLGGATYDWQTFDFDVNLGSGYEYLVAEINTGRANQGGDYIAIDRFALTPGTPPL